MASYFGDVINLDPLVKALPSMFLHYNVICTFGIDQYSEEVLWNHANTLCLITFVL